MKDSTLIIITLGVVALLFVIDFIKRVIFYRKNKELKRFGFEDVKLVISLLIVFFIIVVSYLKSGYDSYLNSVPQNAVNAATAIADMQANTLTIAGLVVALASLILTVLTIYKEKKANYDNHLINQSYETIKKAEQAIKELANIASIQFVGEKQREFYSGAIRQYIEEKSQNPQDSSYIHFRIIIISSLLNGNNEGITEDEKYDLILKYSEEIIENPHATTLDIRFAYMESLHALYQKIKRNISRNPYAAKKDIKKVNKYLQFVSYTVDDDYGHVANLYGLVMMWSGISEIRCQHKREGMALIQRSIAYFDEAIEKNINKVEFYNHKMVALYQLYAATGEAYYRNDFEKIYEEARKKDINYYKIHLNYASILLVDVMNDVKLEPLSGFPDYSKYTALANVEYQELLEKINYAKELLKKVQQLNPEFINGYYKMGEAITIEIVINNILGKDSTQLIKSAKKNFSKAESISDCTMGYLYTNYCFCKLIGEDEKANELREKIKKQQEQKD